MKLIFDLYPNSSFFYLQGLFPFTCYPCDLWSHRLRQLNFELSLHKTFKWSIEIKFLSPTLSLLIKTRNLRATFYFRYPEFSVSITLSSLCPLYRGLKSQVWLPVSRYYSSGQVKKKIQWCVWLCDQRVIEHNFNGHNYKFHLIAFILGHKTSSYWSQQTEFAQLKNYSRAQCQEGCPQGGSSVLSMKAYGKEAIKQESRSV